MQTVALLFFPPSEYRRVLSITDEEKVGGREGGGAHVSEMGARDIVPLNGRTSALKMRPFQRRNEIQTPLTTF